MSLRAIYPIASNIKKLVQIAVTTLEEVPFFFSSQGMTVEGLSPDKTFMILAELPSSTFEEYNLTEELAFVAIKDDLKKAFRRGSKREEVVFEYSKGDRELKVKVLNPRSGIEREYNVALSEAVPQRLGGLELELEVSFRIPSDEFASIIKDAAVVGDELSIHYSSETNSIKIFAHGELASYSTELKQFRPLTMIESTISNASAKYSVDHLKHLTKILDLAEEVTVSFGPDKPMQAIIEFGGGTIKVWIAPRG